MKRNRYLYPILIALLGFLIYSNTLKHGYVLDDIPAIPQNQYVQEGISGIPQLLSSSYHQGYSEAPDNLYRPLSLITFALEESLVPDSPSFHHLAQVLLYVLTGLLLFFTLKLILPLKYNQLPLAASLLFIAHPIHTEVVANLKSRDEILVLLFGLLTLYLLFRFVKEGRPGFFLASLGVWFLALLSKESAITWLAIFPLALYYFESKPLKKILTLAAVYAGIAAVFLVLRAVVLAGVADLPEIPIIDNFLMASPDGLSYFSTDFLVLGEYVSLLTFPLSFSYEYGFDHISTGLGNPKVWLALILYVGMLGLALWRIRQKPLWGFAILFFLITLSVYSNLFLSIGSGMAERFVYQSSVGFCLLLSWGLFEVWERIRIGHKKYAFWISLQCLLAFYAFQTLARNPDWESNLELFSADIVKVPNSARAHCYYGSELIEESQKKGLPNSRKKEFLEKAKGELITATEIFRKSLKGKSYGYAEGQLGLVYFYLGETEMAIQTYEKALQGNENRSVIRTNLGVALAEVGRRKRAISAFQLAIQEDGRNAHAHKNLGAIYYLTGNYGEARKVLENAAQLFPRNPEILQYLSLNFEKLGMQSQAQEWKRRFETLRP